MDYFAVTLLSRKVWTYCIRTTCSTLYRADASNVGDEQSRDDASLTQHESELCQNRNEQSEKKQNNTRKKLAKLLSKTINTLKNKGRSPLDEPNARSTIEDDNFTEGLVQDSDGIDHAHDSRNRIALYDRQQLTRIDIQSSLVVDKDKASNLTHEVAAVITCFYTR